MVSGLNTADTSKGGASLRNDLCEYLWFKKHYYEDLRISSFDIVMQLLVCKILLICFFGGWDDEKSFREFISCLKVHSSKN